jgi:hypothetical protein
MRCGDIADCAQKAVEAAAAAQHALEDAKTEIEALRSTLTNQEQLNAATRTGFQTLKANSMSQPGTGAPVGNAYRQTNTLRCGAGEYLVGLNLSWAGTCNNQCNGDVSGVLAAVAPVCQKF